VSTRRIEGCQCTAPTWLRTCTWAVLRRGLDSVLSVVSAQPAEWAARDLVVELLPRYLVWRSDGGSRATTAAWTRRYTA
jgi:hypothetical protein